MIIWKEGFYAYISVYTKSTIRKIKLHRRRRRGKVKEGTVKIPRLTDRRVYKMKYRRDDRGKNVTKNREYRYKKKYKSPRGTVAFLLNKNKNVKRSRKERKRKRPSYICADLYMNLHAIQTYLRRALMCRLKRM